jgi:excisionase family DNA binding protein
MGSFASDSQRTPAPVSGRSSAQGIDAALDELLTVDEVAALLKVSKGWVYEHVRSRSKPRSEQLPHIKVGKYIRFDPQALRTFIANKCRAT